jgi:hypothetical protein
MPTMAIQFEPTENGGRKTKQKLWSNGVFAELEIPSGRDPQQNAWLTLTLGYSLTFMDRNTPRSGGTNPNADRCYGEAPEELRNIMGDGRDITLINSAPWREHLGKFTQQNMGKWSMVLMTGADSKSLPPAKVSGKGKKR